MKWFREGEKEVYESGNGAVLKGHGFSRAAEAPDEEAALAAKEIHAEAKTCPPGRKPTHFIAPFTARLKPRRFNATDFVPRQVFLPSPPQASKSVWGPWF